MKTGRCTFTVKELADCNAVNVEMYEGIGDRAIDKSGLYLIVRDGVPFEDVERLARELQEKIISIGISER